MYIVFDLLGDNGKFICSESCGNGEGFSKDSPVQISDRPKITPFSGDD